MNTTTITVTTAETRKLDPDLPPTDSAFWAEWLSAETLQSLPAWGIPSDLPPETIALGLLRGLVAAGQSSPKILSAILVLADENDSIR